MTSITIGIKMFSQITALLVFPVNFYLNGCIALSNMVFFIIYEAGILRVLMLCKYYAVSKKRMSVVRASVNNRIISARLPAYLSDGVDRIDFSKLSK